MGCVLRAFGREFDPDQFLQGATVSPSKVWRKGEPRIGPLHGKVQDNSGLNVTVSSAAIGDLEQQTRDAVGFLRNNKQELARLVAFRGLERAGLDFAVEWSKGAATQTDCLSRELIGLAGELGLDIEVSHYPISEESEVTGGVH